LRTHGWKPEARHDEHFDRDYVIWTHSSLPDRSIHTGKPGDWTDYYFPDLGRTHIGPLWYECHHDRVDQRWLTRLSESKKYCGLAGLRRRLEELARRKK
jgi:hypothetical protein